MSGSGFNTPGEQDLLFGETENGMNTELDAQIHELRQMTTAQLQRKYCELFGQESHCNHKITYSGALPGVQALVEGGLSDRARQYARASLAMPTYASRPAAVVGNRPRLASPCVRQ
jgi:hypothetical protein